MPTLQRRHPSPDLRRVKVSTDVEVHPMVKSNSHSSSEDDSMDLPTPKQITLSGHQTNKLPIRYESDEESVSPCPEDFEDASSFSDIEFDSSLDLNMDELPSIVEVRRVAFTQAPCKPLLIDVSKLAPMEKRTTAAHVRPGAPSGLTIKTSIGRTVVVSSNGDNAHRPAAIALQRAPMRFRAPPPVPPRSDARTTSPATPIAPQYPPPQVPLLQQSSFPPRQSSQQTHGPRPSVSTIATLDDTDDGRSSIAGDSTASSAPSSVADEADLAARYVDAKIHDEGCPKGNTPLHQRQDADLERAINDYMMWRNEGSPGEPPETVYKLSHEDKQMVRDHEEDEWRRELEKGLTTPTPTSYAAYDPFGVNPPSLARPKAPFNGEPVDSEPSRARGLRKPFGKMRRHA